MDNFFKSTLQSEDLYLNHWRSTLGSINETCEELKALGYVSEDCQVVNLDTHADMASLPSTDLILFQGFMMEESDNGCYEIGFFVGFSPFSDLNGFKTARVMSYLYGRYKGLSCYKVFDKNGGEIGEIVVFSGTAVSPVTKADTRMCQFVEVGASSDITQTFIP